MDDQTARAISVWELGSVACGVFCGLQQLIVCCSGWGPSAQHVHVQPRVLVSYSTTLSCVAWEWPRVFMRALLGALLCGEARG